MVSDFLDFFGLSRWLFGSPDMLRLQATPKTGRTTQFIPYRCADFEIIKSGLAVQGCWGPQRLT